MTDSTLPMEHRDDRSAAGERALAIVFGLVDTFVRGEGRQRPSEIAQFEVLMQHFLPKIDDFSRAVVAQKLAPCASLPASILKSLALDRDEVAEPVLASAPRLPQPVIDAIMRSGSAALRACLKRRDERRDQPREPVSRSGIHLDHPLPQPAPAQQVTQETPQRTERSAAIRKSLSQAGAFLDAAPSDRQAYLLHLTEMSEGEAPQRIDKASFDALLRLLTLRQYDGVAQILSDVLSLPAPLTRRMIDDPHGEALVIAGRIMGLEEDQFLRLVLLGNAQTGRAVNRVYALRALYRKVSPQAALRLISGWREGKTAGPRFAPFDNRRAPMSRQALTAPAAQDIAAVERLSGRK